MYRKNDLEMRVLVLAPTGRDAVLLQQTFSAANLQSQICEHIPALLEELSTGAATALIAQEALSPESVSGLGNWLTSQPTWSDIPFIVLTSKGRSNRTTFHKARELQALGNVTFLERPFRPETIEAGVRAALRARMRQYEIRRRQETLTRANLDLEQFAYTASHDLQEPIRNMAIYSTLISREYADRLDEQGLTYLQFVSEGAHRMESLVAGLLEYTKAATIVDELPEPVNAGKQLRLALLNLAEVIRENEADVVYCPLPDVRVRELHLQQLFQNLIGNAIKYRSAEKPHISITAEREGTRWRLGVHDNGIGIQAEYTTRIFGLFKRLHGHDEYSGTGIGLAICQRIVDRYMGRIWVESVPGKGSSFFLTLPA
jgi:signal transduction histidine kinase